MNVCMIIHSRKLDDDRMRPGTPTPDKHWISMLVSTIGEIQPCGRVFPPKGVYQRYRDGDWELVIEPQVAPHIFKHVMDFVRMHGLTYEFPDNMIRCASCPGNVNCLANQHTIRSIKA